MPYPERIFDRVNELLTFIHISSVLSTHFNLMKKSTMSFFHSTFCGFFIYKAGGVFHLSNCFNVKVVLNNNFVECTFLTIKLISTIFASVCCVCAPDGEFNCRRGLQYLWFCDRDHDLEVKEVTS